MKSIKQKSIKQIVKRIIEINKAINDMKKMYRELDELTAQAIAMKFKNGHGARLVDNFKEKNTAFKSVAHRRFDVVLDDSFFKVRKSR